MAPSAFNGENGGKPRSEKGRPEMRLKAIALDILGALLTPRPAPAVETYSSLQFHQLIAKATVPDRNSEQLYLNRRNAAPPAAPLCASAVSNRFGSQVRIGTRADKQSKREQASDDSQTAG